MRSAFCRPLLPPQAGACLAAAFSSLFLRSKLFRQTWPDVAFTDSPTIEVVHWSRESAVERDAFTSAASTALAAVSAKIVPALCVGGDAAKWPAQSAALATQTDYTRVSGGKVGARSLLALVPLQTAVRALRVMGAATNRAACDAGASARGLAADAPLLIGIKCVLPSTSLSLPLYSSYSCEPRPPRQQLPLPAYVLPSSRLPLAAFVSAGLCCGPCRPMRDQLGPRATRGRCGRAL